LDGKIIQEGFGRWEISPYICYMTTNERKWIIDAIVKSYELCVFKHEEEKLNTLLAKYVNPNNVVSEDEVGDDLTWLDKTFD